MAEFRARKYGRTTAKVLCGKEHVIEQYSPTGDAITFCRKVAEALNKVVDDAMFERGQFRPIKKSGERGRSL